MALASSSDTIAAMRAVTTTCTSAATSWQHCSRACAQLSGYYQGDYHPTVQFHYGRVASRQQGMAKGNWHVKLQF
jgi:hypothetical protein